MQLGSRASAAKDVISRTCPRECSKVALPHQEFPCTSATAYERAALLAVRKVSGAEESANETAAQKMLLVRALSVVYPGATITTTPPRMHHLIKEATAHLFGALHHRYKVVFVVTRKPLEQLSRIPAIAFLYRLPGRRTSHGVRAARHMH